MSRHGRDQAGRGDDARDLEELRRVVVGPEWTRLERLEARPVPNAETLAGILPDAVAEAGRQGDKLALALEPAVKSALTATARRDSSFLGEILAPTIGASVRKAMSDAIAAMLQRFNETLDHSLSLRSWRWRLEARRTHRPFAEIVLLRTLVYRVEQVFLIHPTTGLVLEHVIADGVSVRDPDQVAALLEAIDAFAHEAFQPEPREAHLSSAALGDLTLYIDRDPTVILAAVVRGVAPRALNTQLSESRERIQLSLHDELLRFRSDTAPFAAARPALESCLSEQRVEPPRRAQRWLSILALILIGGLGAIAIRGQLRAREHARLVHRYVDAFAAEPGVVVVGAEWKDGTARIDGFRDPLAQTPAQIAARNGLATPAAQLASFYSLEPAIVAARARRSLRPPPEVSLAVRGDALALSGWAPRAWNDRARALAPVLPGVARLDDTALRDLESLEATTEARRALEGIELPFYVASSEIAAPGRLAGAARAARHFGDVAVREQTAACIVVLGHADPTGALAFNLRLARARAQGVTAALVARGVPARWLHPVGAGLRRGVASDAEARSVTLRAYLGVPCEDLP